MAFDIGAMTELDDLNANQVLEGSFLDEYEKGRSYFYLELVHLNTNIYLLEHVLRFPYHLFVPPGRSLFFRKVFENFFYMSLLIITRIGANQGQGFYTLPRFKNKVRSAVKAEYRDAFHRRLRDARFDATTREVFDRASALRTESVAHILEDVVLGKKEQAQVVFGDIMSLRDHLVKLLETLSFNVGYLWLPIHYSPGVTRPLQQDERNDIEELFDLVATNSPLLHAPENNPAIWEAMRQQLTDEDIEIFNVYREKANLPRV